MKQFLTRVELHGATFADYVTLHTEMAKAKFSRTITSDDGKVYQLPTAEYTSQGYLSAKDVADLAKAAANKTAKLSNVITVEYSKAAFYLDYALSPFASLSSLLLP